MNIYLTTTLLFIFLFTTSLFSNERKFTYTYETSVLPSGAREIEVWNTFRTGRTYFYNRLDQRVEYEFGVGGNLMSSLYMNVSSRTKDSNGELPGGTTTSDVEYSFANEWKYKLLDRVADPVGVGVYGEFSLGTNETDIEGKLLFDKAIDKILLAGNFVVEHEWASAVVNGETEIEKELQYEITCGMSYQFTHALSAGIELRQHNVLQNGSLKHAALFAGPVFSYATEQWWATFTVMPQLTSFKGATEGKLNLEEYERTQVRLLLSFQL